MDVVVVNGERYVRADLVEPFIELALRLKHDREESVERRANRLMDAKVDADLLLRRSIGWRLHAFAVGVPPADAEGLR